MLNKVQIEGLINFFFIAYLSWIEIRICISPYGSGSGSESDFYYTNPDPHHRLLVLYNVWVPE